jgi:hypothetical protein
MVYLDLILNLMRPKLRQENREVQVDQEGVETDQIKYKSPA